MSNNEEAKNGSHEALAKQHIHDKKIEQHIGHITRELKDGFELLQKYPRSVTIFGSSMVSPESKSYKQAYELGKLITKELKYAVIDGGGPGIMEAASKGALDGGGPSVGLRINLMREKTQNRSNTDGMNFTYFFTRKTMLSFAAEAYLFFPGGFGTFDELFSILTLIQTNKIPKVPVILFDSSFWNPLMTFIKTEMLGTDKRLDPHDLELLEISDDMHEVIEKIRKAPVSEWWRNIN